jgi:hypothetical protein
MSLECLGLTGLEILCQHSRVVESHRAAVTHWQISQRSIDRFVTMSKSDCARIDYTCEFPRARQVTLLDCSASASIQRGAREQVSEGGVLWRQNMQSTSLIRHQKFRQPMNRLPKFDNQYYPSKESFQVWGTFPARFQ